MQSFRLGSILGFEIRIDLSWFIIFFLVLWTLTANVFPADYPDLSPGVWLAMGVVGTILFFASLLTHELSHSLVAKAKGIPVEGITLFIFGGISRTRMDAETPGDEFQIAGVGPLVSLLLSALFGLIWWVGNAAGWTVAVTGVAGYLATINLFLAIFNLLPGFPLDGGRLFRSMIWKWTGNLRKATHIASRGGKFLGYLIIAWGIVQLFGGYILSGLWLIFIGWFLSSAAEMSYQQYLVKAGLEGVPARDVMTRSPETVSSNITLQQLLEEYFQHRRYQAFPVIENSHPIGIIGLHQVKSIPPDQRRYRTVQEIMIPAKQDVIVAPETKMTDVLEKMQESELQRVLVVQNDQLEGIITGRDIASWLRRL
ncbi:MAG: site-2 protease family protein [Chroococcales cyanobacterium]